MIDSNTLLQTDAPVIAGILIFLTIYSLDPVPRIGIKRRIKIILAISIVAAIVPFCYSSILIVGSAIDNSDNIPLRDALWAADIGFGYLMSAVITTVMVPFIIQPTTEEKK